MYDHPSQAEPLLPSSLAELYARAQRVVDAANLLNDSIPVHMRSVLEPATREANAWHSNALEAESSPTYIQAHIIAEQALNSAGLVGAQALGSQALLFAHREFYSAASADDMEPGELRQLDVRIQRHIPPVWSSVPEFLARLDQVYVRNWEPAQLLVVVACAHQRLLWVHPFKDGNGRACRLQAQQSLRPLGSHFWSLSAGFARRREEYYLRLAEGDMHRMGDLDGRGNLSQQKLVAWCDFFLDVCHEQILLSTRLV